MGRARRTRERLTRPAHRRSRIELKEAVAARTPDSVSSGASPHMATKVVQGDAELLGHAAIGRWWTVQWTQVAPRERIPADPCGPFESEQTAVLARDHALERQKPAICGLPASGGPRNRTWRCGFGDRRVTDTPVPQKCRLAGISWSAPAHLGRKVKGKVKESSGEMSRRIAISLRLPAPKIP